MQVKKRELEASWVFVGSFPMPQKIINWQAETKTEMMTRPIREAGLRHKAMKLRPSRLQNYLQNDIWTTLCLSIASCKS